MTDELNLDPFTRSHVGPSGAFILRVNVVHADLARAAVRLRRETEETGFVAKQGVVLRLAA